MYGMLYGIKYKAVTEYVQLTQTVKQDKASSA